MLFHSSIFILLFCLAGSFAAFEDIGNELNYKNGVEYHYGYSVNISTQEVYFEKSSDVNYTTEFFVKFFGDTGFLKINNVEIEDNTRDVKIDSKHNALTEHYLRFQMKSGKIEELWPDTAEKSWVLNFKRGLLSLFHSDMKKADVIDVHGNCPTNYSLVREEGDQFEIERQKDLEECNSEEQFPAKYIIFGIPIHIPDPPPGYPGKKSDPRIRVRGEQNCTHIISKKIFDHIECLEVYKIRVAGRVNTSVSQLVEFKTEIPGQENLQTYMGSIQFNPVANSVNLIYDVEDYLAPMNPEAKLTEAKSYIDAICAENFEVIGIETPTIYLNYIHASKALSYAQLESLEEYAIKCPFSKQFFASTLIHVRSHAAIMMMLDTIDNDELDKYTQEEWLAIIALQDEINLPILKKAKHLLDKKASNPNVVLTVGLVAGAYCKQHEKCKDHIALITDDFEKHIKTIYGAPHDDETYEDPDEKLYVYLKGLGNIDSKTSSINETLKKIFLDTTMPPYVRLAALDLCPQLFHFEKHPDLLSWPVLEKVFEDPNEDVEVRIGAYLSLFKNTKIMFVPSIYKILKGPTNQVTHFIWSYINQTRMYGYEHTENSTLNDFITCKYTKCESTDAKEMKGSCILETLNEMMSRPDLTRPSDEDVSKFSHYYHGTLERSVPYEGKVVFTPASFVPASVDYELNIEPYEKEMNMFKLYANMQGVEEYFLSLFELEGRSLSKKLETEKHESRERRDAPVKEAKPDPRLSMGFKLFDKDFQYAVFRGDSQMKQFLSYFNALHEINRTLSTTGFNLNKAAVLVDIMEWRPTAAGFPLNYRIMIDYGCSYNVTGKLDAANFYKTSELHFNGEIEPFHAVGATRTFSVDTYYTSSLTKIQSAGYVKPKFHTKVDVHGLSDIQVEYSLPNEAKTDIMHLRVEHFAGSENHDELKMKPTEVHCEEKSAGKVSYRVCGPKDKFMNFTEEVRSKGYYDVPLYMEKLDDGIPQHLVKFQWKKVQEMEYNATWFFNGGPKEETSTAMVKFNTDNGNLDVLVTYDFSEEKLFLDGHYENSATAKYVKFDTYLNDKRYSSIRRPISKYVGYSTMVLAGLYEQLTRFDDGRE